MHFGGGLDLHMIGAAGTQPPLLQMRKVTRPDLLSLGDSRKVHDTL